MREKFAGVLVALLEGPAPEPIGLVHRIEDAIRRTILDGVTKQRDRLPSTRTLASEIGVARATVEAAYQQLETEGFLTRRHGSGTFVAALDRDAPVRSKPRSKPVSRHLRPQATLSERGKEIWRRGGVVDQTVALPFAAAMPDVRPFPRDLWRKITARVLRKSGPSILMYGEAQGFQPLREQIARYLSAHRGVRCTERQVILLSSSQQAMWLIASLLVDPGDRIAVEDPGYHGARSAFAAAGAVLHPVPVDADGLRIDELTRHGARIRAAYVTPSHQYPLGVTLSLERRLALIDWAQRNDGWIIEDDYDSEYRYDGRPLSAIQGLDPHERVLYVGTLSKVLFPSLRLAYLVLPEALAAVFVTARTLLDGQSSLINQVVLAQFMGEGHFTSHIRSMRQMYRARRDAFVDGFTKHLSPYATMAASSGGLQIACLLQDGIAEEETVECAGAADIELPTLRRLYLGPKPRAGWLMGFAASEPAVIHQAIRRFAKKLAARRPIGASI